MKNLINETNKKNNFILQLVNYTTVKLIIVFYIILISLSYGDEIFIGQGSRQLIYDQLAIQDAMEQFFGSKNDKQGRRNRWGLGAAAIPIFQNHSSAMGL